MDFFYFEQIFKDIVAKYLDFFGFDLSYMKLKLSEHPRDTDGRVTKEFPDDEFGGSWTKNKTIFVNSDPKKVIEHWKLDMTVEEFVSWMVAHELAHEIWTNIASKDLKKQTVEMAKEQKFTTEYLKTVPKKKLPEETFCEFMASLINSPYIGK